QPAGTTYGLLLADSTGSIMIDADGVHTLGLLDSAVVTAKLAPAAVTNPKVSSDAIATANVQNAAITTAKIASLTVTTALIADAAVTSAKIQDLTVASADIADAAIVEAKIGSAAVTTAKIANLAVGTAQIADAAVTNAKIASLDAGKITTGFLDAARIAAGSITSEKIAAGAIQAEHIAIGSSVDRAIKTVNASRLPNALPQGGVLFHFDGSLQSTQGVQPRPGYVATLRPGEGKFGGAVAVEEGTENIIGNGHFGGGNDIENAYGHASPQYFEIIPNPHKTGLGAQFDYVLRFNATEGNTCEYEVHPKNGYSLTPGIYTLSLYAYVSPDWDGQEQLLHSRWYYDGGQTRTTHGGFPSQRGRWERISTTIDLSGVTSIERMDFYIGYPQRSTRGYVLVTG